MKKNFFKKLALVMALTLAVGSVPATNVEAAAAPKFKSAKATVKVGQTKNYGIANVSAWSVKKIVVGNKSVATVAKSGKTAKITGVAEGKTTVRADLKAYKTKRTMSVRIPVTVKAVETEVPVVEAELSAVKQTAANAFEANFTADASQKITKDSFTAIESADGIYTVAVKSVEFSTDGKTALVTTYGNFVDKTVFNVTCAGKTASFTASVGDVKNIVIGTTQAQKGKETDIEFKLYDANGIDVTSVIALNAKVIVDVTGDYSSADVAKAADATITMDTVGAEAVVTVTYDAQDGSAEVKATQVVTCVDAVAEVGTKQLFTLAGDEVPKFYLNSYTPNTTLYMDTTQKGYFAALDNAGNAISYDEYEIETSNDNVFTVNGNAGEGKYVDFTIDPVSTGTAQVIIKATKNDKSYTYVQTVTVKAARVATSIALSNVPSKLAATGSAVGWLSAVVLDQYGKVMYGPSGNITGEVVNAKESPVEIGYDKTHFGITVDPEDATVGTHTVELTGADTYGNEVHKRFSVSVVEVPDDGNVTYKFTLGANTIDLNPEDVCSLSELATSAKFAQYINGVFNGYVTKPADANATTPAAITIKKGNQTYSADLTVTAASITTGWDGNMTINAVSGGALSTVSSSNEVTLDPKENAVAETGTYTVTLTYYDKNGREVNKSATFRVTNTQEMPTVVVSATGVDYFGDIKDKCLTTDVNMLDADGNENIDGLYNYNAAAKTYTEVDDFDAHGRAFVNRVAVKDMFENAHGEKVTYIYYVPVTKTFKAE